MKKKRLKSRYVYQVANTIFHWTVSDSWLMHEGIAYQVTDTEVKAILGEGYEIRKKTKKKA